MAGNDDHNKVSVFRLLLNTSIFPLFFHFRFLMQTVKILGSTAYLLTHLYFHALTL